MTTKSRFDLLLDSIRPYILDYLESKNYDTSSQIRCINPLHEDKTPSMLCSRAEEHNWTVHCLGCGYTADIFNAYAILEGTPEKGPKWINETVLPLAAMFEVNIPEIEVSPEKQFLYDLSITLEYVAGLLNHDPTRMESYPLSYIQEKGWRQETLEELDIGTLSYGDVQRYVSEEDRKRFGLNRPDVFDSSNLIFTARDQHGRALRFFARKGREQKFSSTTTSNLAYDPWKGKGHLYLSHKTNRNSPQIMVVEGHPDAVTLYQEGIENVVATAGCSHFSETHANSLVMRGFSKVTFMYDGDKSGQDAMETLLRKDFVKTGILLYEVVVLPEGHDPDSYVREEGIEKTRHLINNLRVNAFEFLLSKEDPGSSPDELCDRLVPHIAASKSNVKREMMARELSSFLEERVSTASILDDVKMLDDIASNEIFSRQKAVVTAVARQAQSNIPQAKEIFRGALDELDNLDRTFQRDDARISCLAEIQACKARQETVIVGGYELGPHLHPLSEILSGGTSWAGAKIILVGGVRNVGKSTFIDNFIWEAISNPRNNAIVYLLTMDDASEARFIRMGCSAVDSREFTQGMMANPRLYEEELGYKNVYARRERAYRKLFEAVSAGKLIIEDGPSTLAHAERRIAHIRRENPDSNIVLALDNFHNLTDWENLDETPRVIRQISYAKRICTMNKVLGLFATEYRKLQNPNAPGTDDDLASTRKLGYDSHLTLHMFSDYDYKGEESALLVHEHEGNIYPRVIVDIGKNKITRLKGKNMMIFDLYPEAARLEPVDRMQAEMDEKARRETLSQRKAAKQSTNGE